MVHTLESFILVHADVITGNSKQKYFSIVVENGIITHIGPDDVIAPFCSASLPVFDAKGKIAGPGLIDMHIHGAGGFDTANLGAAHNLLQMAIFLEARGITSFQPTIVMNMITLENIRSALQTNPFIAKKIKGVYVEGPFICEEKKGGIPSESIASFSEDLLNKILSLTFQNRPLVTTMTLAPEKAGSDRARAMLIENGVVPAWGHSNAYFDEIHTDTPCHLTHLFNAMNGLDHRRPGLAVLPFLRKNTEMTFELIGDSVHVSSAMLELVFDTPARENMCLISDAMSSGGLGSGETMYLGKSVICDGRCSRYKDSGTLIGSAMLISQTAKELFERGLINEIDFFRIASTNPAAVTGMTDRGILHVGKKADIVLCSPEMEIVEVFTC